MRLRPRTEARRHAEAKSGGVPRRHREPGIAHGAHVVEQMEAKPDVSDVFAPVPVEIELSNFRLPESILHGRINHSISTGRRDSNLFQPRKVEVFPSEKRSYSGAFPEIVPARNDRNNRFLSCANTYAASMKCR